MTATTATALPRSEFLRARTVRLLAPATVVVILAVFGASVPGYFAPTNLLNVASAGALLLMAACAMTIVVRAGGIDLSIGVAIDLAALASTALIADGYVTWFAVLIGIGFGVLAGVVNAILVIVFRIRAFLATLSVWFIGTSAQQLLTGGGAPIYLRRQETPSAVALPHAANASGVSWRRR